MIRVLGVCVAVWLGAAAVVGALIAAGAVREGGPDALEVAGQRGDERKKEIVALVRTVAVRRGKEMD